MKITRTEILHSADLAQLGIGQEDIPGILSDLETILDYFNTLQALDTEDVPPFQHSRDSAPLLRKDDPRASLPRETVLKNARSAKDPFFQAPRRVKV